MTKYVEKPKQFALSYRLAFDTFVVQSFAFHDVCFARLTAPRPDASCEWFVHWDIKGNSDDQVVVAALSVTECMRLCEDEETCVSLSYNTGSNECRLHTQHVHSLAMTTDNSGWGSYDHYCFQGACLFARLCGSLSNL